MSLKNQIITFIGGGNMATALIGGLVAGGHSPQRIRVGDPDVSRRKRLKTDYSVGAFANNAAAIAGADVVVLAVKPQMLPAVVAASAEAIRETTPLVVSIAAGVTTASLESRLGKDVAVVRVMPNTPALVGCGAAGLFANSQVTEAQRATASAIVAAAGEGLWVDDEALMDAVTATSGSGPAYFFLVIELMTQAAIGLGLAPDDAEKLVTQTAMGAATMVKNTATDVAELRRRVTSPGGTTAAALETLYDGGIADLFERALTAARDRGRELSADGE